METISSVVTALIAEPVAAVMAVTAASLTIATVLASIRTRERVLTIVLAVMSGVTAWLMASHWRWPK